MDASDEDQRQQGVAFTGFFLESWELQNLMTPEK